MIVCNSIYTFRRRGQEVSTRRGSETTGLSSIRGEYPSLKTFLTGLAYRQRRPRKHLSKGCSVAGSRSAIGGRSTMRASERDHRTRVGRPGDRAVSDTLGRGFDRRTSAHTPRTTGTLQAERERRVNSTVMSERVPSVTPVRSSGPPSRRTIADRATRLLFRVVRRGNENGTRTGTTRVDQSAASAASTSSLSSSSPSSASPAETSSW